MSTAAGLAEPNEAVNSPTLQAGIIDMMMASTVLMSSPAWQTEQSSFKVVDAGDRRIRVEWTPGMGDPPPAGTTVEIRCTLPDGRYRMSGVFEEASSRGLVFHIGTPIYHSQMRRDFRVDVPSDNGITFELSRCGDRYLPEGSVARVSNLSVGGAEIKWHFGRPLPKKDDRVEGVIDLGRHSLELAAIVRRVHQRDESVLVSVEFLDVRITDRQHLLAACFELQREMMHKGEEDN
jgi:PilZ domain